MITCALILSLASYLTRYLPHYVICSMRSLLSAPTCHRDYDFSPYYLRPADAATFLPPRSVMSEAALSWRRRR